MNQVKFKYRRPFHRRPTILVLAFLFLAIAMLGAGWSWLVYSREVEATFHSEQAFEVPLDGAIDIVFSAPMIPQTFRGKIALEPSREVRLEWRDQNRRLRLRPADRWKPETEYRVNLGGGKNIFLMETSGGVSFRTENYPRVADFSPAPDSRNILLDIEDPISVAFNRPLDHYKVKFAVDPYVELESQIDFAERRIELVPKAALERGKRYTVIVYVKELKENDDAYRRIYQTAFTTKPEEPKVWEKDLSLRLQQARQFTEARVLTGKYIDVNLKSQVMAIFENGQILDTYIISSGRRGMDTPQGTFQIRNKYPRAWSSKYALYMPFWMAFVPSGDYGIHELPEWPGGYKEGANHLGIPVSHGCIRLGVGPAERVYDWAEIGTPVMIHY